jgi:hypothetical protein
VSKDRAENKEDKEDKVSRLCDRSQGCVIGLKAVPQVSGVLY